MNELDRVGITGYAGKMDSDGGSVRPGNLYKSHEWPLCMQAAYCTLVLYVLPPPTFFSPFVHATGAKWWLL